MMLRSLTPLPLTWQVPQPSLILMGKNVESSPKTDLEERCSADVTRIKYPRAIAFQNFMYSESSTVLVTSQIFSSRKTCFFLPQILTFYSDVADLGLTFSLSLQVFIISVFSLFSSSFLYSFPLHFDVLEIQPGLLLLLLLSSSWQFAFTLHF